MKKDCTPDFNSPPATRRKPTALGKAMQEIGQQLRPFVGIGSALQGMAIDLNIRRKKGPASGAPTPPRAP